MRNFQSYYERMGKNIEEKTDFIIQELQTGDYEKVLDFGCANGAVIEDLAQRFPKIQFYGYDKQGVISENLSTQLRKIKSLNIFYTYGLGEVIVDNKTLVILSSVLHENFYGNHFIPEFETVWYKYLRFAETITIRDMRGDFFLGQTENIAQKLIAKNLYADNYEEEMKENYFSINWSFIKQYMQDEKYELVYEHWYMNQYLKKEIPEINTFLCKTHCKQIWKRRKTL